MMKKIFLLLILLQAYTGLAQESYRFEKSINAFNLLIFKTIDVSLERFIDQESSWGIAALISLDDKSRVNGDNPYYNETIALTPFYRLYFGSGEIAGFFVEGFGNLSFGHKNDWSYDDFCYGCDYVYNSSYHTKSFTSLNLGISLGRKWVTKKDVSFSVYAGIGRALLTDNGPSFFPRLGILLGKRK